jgi:hypothetical protein
MKYTRDDLERMGYKLVKETDKKEYFESIYDSHKRIVMKKDENDGKYLWWGLW